MSIRGCQVSRTSVRQNAAMCVAHSLGYRDAFARLRKAETEKEISKIMRSCR